MTSTFRRITIAAGLVATASVGAVGVANAAPVAPAPHGGATVAPATTHHAAGTEHAAKTHGTKHAAKTHGTEHAAKAHGTAHATKHTAHHGVTTRP